MGPDGTPVTTSDFTDKIPPSFDGRSNYASYKEDVLLWTKLTGLASSKQGPALVGRLSGEAKASAKSISVDTICTEQGVDEILTRLDKSYAVDAANQLDSDLASFLDYSWNKSLSVEQYIAGFHSRLDKLATLQLDCKLKGHLLLRQASLPAQEKNMVVGAASGSYDVSHLTTALRNAYIHAPPSSTTMVSNDPPYTPRSKPNHHNVRHNRPASTPSSEIVRPTFYTYKTSSPTISHTGAILDSGACASVVGKNSLDKTLHDLNMQKIPDASPAREEHRFGDHPECHRTICAVKFPFSVKDENDNVTTQFDIQFDVVEGNLPFLVGLPSLMAMRACLSFKFKNLGLKIGPKYIRIPLSLQNNHVLLPFTSVIKRAMRDGLANRSESNSQYTSSPPIYSPESYYHPTDRRTDQQSNSGQTPIMNQVVTHDERQPTERPAPSRMLTGTELRKLHLQLKHASISQLRNYLRTAELWHSQHLPLITSIVTSCKCQLALPPSPHAVASTSPPNEDVQTHLAVDVIHLEGHNFLHCLDRSTGWSEVGLLSRRDLSEQVRIFRDMQINKHGVPRSIICDREYNKGQFSQYCGEMKIQLTPVPAHAHESNGAIERANRSLRSHFDRLRHCDRRSHISDIVSEAAFAKNINRGNRIASAFELLYRRQPRISGDHDIGDKPIPTMREHASDVAQRKINAMLRANVRDPDLPDIGNEVYFWRDDSGWVGPASVLKIGRHDISILHNGSVKSSSFNRVRRIQTETPQPDSENADTEPVSTTSSAHIFIDDEEDDHLPLEDVDETGSIPSEPSIDITPIVDNESTTNEETNPILPSRTRHVLRAAELRTLQQESADFINRTNNETSCPRSTRTSTRHDNLTNVSNVTSNTPPIDASYSSTTPFVQNIPPSADATNEERRCAYKREYESWVNEDAFVRVNRSSVPSDANIVGSHTVYRRKDDGSLKARIVPWGHRDSERENLRSDSPCLNLEILRLVLSLAAERLWNLGQMDVSTAFLQAQGFDRIIYARPPKEADDPSGLWQLLSAAYGLVDSGRLWFRTSDHALVSQYRLTKSRYEPTLYYKQLDGELIFALVVQVDNYIYAGTRHEMSIFEDFLQKRFNVGSLDRKCFCVMGCEISQDDTGTIVLTQRSRIAEIDDSELAIVSTDPGKSPDRHATAKELRAYRSILGKMLYVGRLSHPIMLYHASSMATKINELKLHHLKDLRALLRFDKKSVPTLRFISPSHAGPFILEAVSDASMSSVSEGGARGGFVIVRRHGDITHPIHWSARKLRRVARSSSTAELLAASDAVSSLMYIQHLTSELTYRHDTSMYVDSRTLLNLATTIREPTEAANKIDLAFLRERFTPHGVCTFGWIPGYCNISDGLTKDNRTSAALLLRVLREGMHPHHPDTITRSAEPLLITDERDRATDIPINVQTCQKPDKAHDAAPILPYERATQE